MKKFLFYILNKIRLLTLSASSIGMTLIALYQSVIVQWLPNSEPDLAGYKVYYGTASQSYSRIIPVGLSTQYTISDLEPGYQYYFAVAAFDTAGNESPLSNEVSIFIENDEQVITADHQNAYNFPNPFNPEIQVTQIRYHLLKSETVSIIIFDVGGNKVQTLIHNVQKSPGEHYEDSWNGKDEHGNLVPNGIYYANVSSPSKDHYITIVVTR